MRALLAMVSIEVAAPPLGVTEEGEKLQVAPVGRPEHARVTALLKPPAGVTVSVVVTD
jgi:hypothetical protein